MISTKSLLPRGVLVGAIAGTLIAAGGCSMIGSKPDDANVESLPPEANTITKTPQVHWENVENGEKKTGEPPTAPETKQRPQSLWTLMRGQFELPDSANKRITAKRNWYASHPEYLERVAQRAKPYLYFIVQSLKKHDIPIDIALLPVVESAFDPFAYSRSRASGLWQFMPQTGRRFELRQNWWFDGRRDVAASTRAAIRYLLYLHSRFDDWLLALAAYNSGGGRVAWAVRKNKRQGKPTNFWQLDLPRQTRAYVPWLLAIRDIIEDPDKYGINLPKVPNQPYLTEVPLDKQINIARAARMVDLPLKKMYLLNAGYNRWATEPGRQQTLLVPISERAEFVAQVAALSDKDRVEWSHHKIARGETLSSIAHHYGTTVSVLKTTNELNSNVIRAGHYLMVPDAASSLNKLALTQIRSLRQDELAKQRRKIHYVVRPGDSFWAIGQRYGISAAAIARWNNMSKSSTLRVGEKLTLWRDRDAPRQRKVKYTIRTGDSLWTISRRYDVTTRELARWNHIARNDILTVGDHLVVWPHGHAAASATNVSASAKQMRRKISYTVRSGDSLWSISNQFDIDVKQLAKWNSISVSDYLHPGQQLVLYVGEEQVATQS